MCILQPFCSTRDGWLLAFLPNLGKRIFDVSPNAMAVDCYSNDPWWITSPCIYALEFPPMLTQAFATWLALAIGTWCKLEECSQPGAYALLLLWDHHVKKPRSFRWRMRRPGTKSSCPSRHLLDACTPSQPASCLQSREWPQVRPTELPDWTQPKFLTPRLFMRKLNLKTVFIKATIFWDGLYGRWFIRWPSDSNLRHLYPA